MLEDRVLVVDIQHHRPGALEPGFLEGRLWARRPVARLGCPEADREDKIFEYFFVFGRFSAKPY